MINALDHLIIAVSDLDAAEENYTKIFGVNPIWRGEHKELGTENSLFNFQNTYFESLFDGGLVFHMKDSKNNPISFGLSTGVRLWSLDNGIDPSVDPNKIVDAIIPAISASVKGVDVGFAFDINISKFSEANNRRGGPELFIRKRIFNCLVAPPFRPNCNIF